MLEVPFDKNILDDHKHAETNSMDYLFESIVFLYNFLGKNPEYLQEFNFHCELLEGILKHIDESTPDLSSEEVSKLLDNIRIKFETKLKKEVPVAEEDAENVYDVFSDKEQNLIVSERVAFFSIVKDSLELKNFGGSREKFLVILFYFYGKLGSYLYSLKDQFGDLTFQSKVKKVLMPSLNPEDIYFELSIANEMKRIGVDLKFIAEKKDAKTPDFEIFFKGESLGCLECTVRKQKGRTVVDHVMDGLTSKAEQMKNFQNSIRCLCIGMPYDLNVKNIEAKMLKKDGIILLCLTDRNGSPFDKTENETLKVAVALQKQSAFTHLLVSSNQVLKFLPGSVGWFPKRRLFQMKDARIFPGNWPEGIMLV